MQHIQSDFRFSRYTFSDLFKSIAELVLASPILCPSEYPVYVSVVRVSTSGYLTQRIFRKTTFFLHGQFKSTIFKSRFVRIGSVPSARSVEREVVLSRRSLSQPALPCRRALRFLCPIFESNGFLCGNSKTIDADANKTGNDAFRSPLVTNYSEIAESTFYFAFLNFAHTFSSIRLSRPIFLVGPLLDFSFSRKTRLMFIIRIASV